MTPAKIDIDAMARRLRMMEEALGSLRGLGEVDEDRLRAEPITRAAVERLVQVVVDLAFDINGHLVVAYLGRAPETGRQSFLDLATAGVLDATLGAELAPSAGLRNVLVHHYVDVRVDLVAASVGQVLTLYPGYVQAIARSLVASDEPRD